jgi:hypothetical protein
MTRNATCCVARAAPKHALGTRRAIAVADPDPLAPLVFVDETPVEIVVAMLPPMT